MAFTSAKMGLRIWNLLTDLYDHSQLADNWAKLDYHDHSPGKGVQIPTEGIADGAVTGPKLAAALDPSGAYTGARLLHRTGGLNAGAVAAATYITRTDHLNLSVVPAAAGSSAVYLNPALWTASGRVVRCLLTGGLFVNAVAPTSTYSFALFPVATWGGISGSVPTVATIGTAVGTTPTIIAPPASAPVAPVSVEFDAPTAGWYVIGVIQVGAQAANTNVTFHASLFVKQV